MNGQSYPIDAKVWINSLAYKFDKSLYYFKMLNYKCVVFGNVIRGLTLQTKLKLKPHKVNKSKGKYNGWPCWNFIIVSCGPHMR